MKIPIEQQQLQREPLEILNTALRVQGHLSGYDVRAALERALGVPLPSILQQQIERLIDPFKSLGRPAREPSVRAREEFAMKKLEPRYQLLRLEFEAGGPSPDGRPPSERAYEQLVREMKKDFGNIDWRALQNKRSAWRTGGLHASAETVDSEDFDAEIDQQFPAHNKKGEF
ncbi:hypothetical protein IVB18_36120 [Bradyrhizobium sp. 186]|uniref:hypothetical protein n=1 Tax=Bradyrhizobium sp. 186 TaxID=2782654 RepID=UPI002000FBFC|nr:hypothetical protein [Bradyrhizobium sp. 186]UPK33584.1 hypothetical protein IVB18_36120 [Bradyrhizobium sp. 186]